MNNTQYLVLAILGFLLIYTPYVPVVSAHLAGQPPFFKINGKYANLYPVPLTSLYDFDLPQDLPAENYLVDQTLNFEFDQSRLPAPPEVIAKTRFDWDFGDGSKAQGLKNDHKFTKTGSHILKVYAFDNTTPKPQLIESVLINILPDKNYSLPKARIIINNKESKDPLTDIIQADLKTRVQIDGSKSTTSNKIAEYFWDFGDQASATGPTQSHKYKQDLSQVFVVFRIKDQNGFISDNFVEIQNNQGSNPNPAKNPIIPNNPKKPNQLPLTLRILTALVIIFVMARQYVLGRRRENH